MDDEDTKRTRRRRKQEEKSSLSMLMGKGNTQHFLSRDVPIHFRKQYAQFWGIFLPINTLISKRVACIHSNFIPTNHGESTCSVCCVCESAHPYSFLPLRTLSRWTCPRGRRDRWRESGGGGGGRTIASNLSPLRVVHFRSRAQRTKERERGLTAAD